MIRAGIAPSFTLESPSGTAVSLRDFVGLYVVLAVVPLARSPQARDAVAHLRGLAESLSPLEARAVALLPQASQGLSRVASPSVILLSDPAGVVAAAYGVVDEPAVFLLDRSGAVRRTWTGLEHSEEVLEAVREIRAADDAVNSLIQARRAWRALSPEPVPREALERLVEAAHLAPSCFNNQPWRFVIAQGEALAKVKAALPGGNYWAKTAPAIVALASHRDLDCKLSDNRDYFLFGCGMATGFLMLQATQMGLVAHPIAGYDPIAVKEALGIPPDYVLITLIVVGRRGDPSTLSDKHRALELGPRDRKPLPTVLMWDRFTPPEGTEER